MKYSIKEFANEIRKLYPGDYDDLSDKELVNLWLIKHPQDLVKVNFNTKYTIYEFAQEIRRLYPRDYDDLSDSELVKLWLKKYPEDTIKVDFESVTENESSNEFNRSFPANTYQSNQERSPVIKKPRLSVAVLLMVGVAVVAGIGLLILNKTGNSHYTRGYNKYNDSINTSVADGQINDNTINSNQQSTNNNTQSAEDAIDNPDKSQSSDVDLILEGGTGVNIENNTKFNNIYSKLPDSEKDYYLKVITQYNPDPKGIQGKICDYGYSHCKWCNSQISYEKYYSSRVAGLQSYVSSNDLGALGAILDLYGNPTTQNIVSNAIMSTLYGNKSNNPIAESVINELDRIRNNDIYYCVGSGPEFCSEKCKYSYNWAHGYK